MCFSPVQEAIAANQFYDQVLTISDGDVEAALGEAEHVLEGEARVGGQDHFYLETQACLAVPKGEDGEMEIISATHGLNNVQIYAAAALDVLSNRIVVKAKRIGNKKIEQSTLLSRKERIFNVGQLL